MTMNKLVNIYNRYREQILYLVFGGVTTLISIITYAVFTELADINILIANILSWIISVAVAYATNKSVVFRSDKKGVAQVLTEALSFYAGRLLTLLIEEAILFVFIDLAKLPNMPVKIIAQIIIIVLNYIISKVFIFKKTK
ncbi:MAG: GtrA family protein [Clostridia bacterium]|nr:GtrA family protein [Clostridia bacterium]